MSGRLPARPEETRAPAVGTPGPDGALRQAARWRLLGLLLERPRGGWHQQVARLACELAEPALSAAATAAATAREGDYLRLLGPGGAISPREAGHRKYSDPGRILAEIGILHEAFGFRLKGEDPVDHVASEVAFSAYLHLKEGWARAQGDDEAAAAAAAAGRLFRHEHLAWLAAGLAPALAEADVPHLAAAGRLLREWSPEPPARAEIGSEPVPCPFAEGEEGCAL